MPSASPSVPVLQGVHNIDVIVPLGMAGGQIVQVQTPGGVQQVEIPAGLKPGQTFRVPVPQPVVVVAQPVPIPATLSMPAIVGAPANMVMNRNARDEQDANEFEGMVPAEAIEGWWLWHTCLCCCFLMKNEAIGPNTFRLTKAVNLFPMPCCVFDLFCCPEYGDPTDDMHRLTGSNQWVSQRNRDNPRIPDTTFFYSNGRLRFWSDCYCDLNNLTPYNWGCKLCATK